MLTDKIKSFIKHEVWRISLKNETTIRAYIIRALQIILIAFRGYNEDKVQLRASALTFYSLLSIVPVLAMAFGIAEAFGLSELLNTEIKKAFTGQEEVLQYLLTFADRMFTNTSGPLMALIAFAMLLWSIMKVFGNIEHSFNSIWQIQKSRAFVRKFSDYLSLMLVAPLLMLFSTGTSVISNVTELGGTDGLLSYVGPILSTLINLVPYTLIWVVLSLIYIIMPNTKVELKSGIIAGIIIGIGFQLFQMVYMQLQGSLTSYSRIYGSFAALPLFLIWMRISWLLVLFGAEISYAIQNIEDYEFEKDSLKLSNHRKKGLLLLVAHKIISNFKPGNKPLTAQQIAKTTEIPIRLVRELIYTLLDANIIIEAKTTNIKENAYVPSTDIHSISVGYILEKIELTGTDNLKLIHSEALNKLDGIMHKNITALKENNKLLVKDL